MKTALTTRKSIWPVALIGWFVLFITTIGCFISFAVKQDVHLVREDYYAAELDYQNDLDRVNRTLALGHEVIIEYSARHQKLGVRIPTAHVQSLESGRIQFYRPDDPGQDRSHDLQVNASGLQFLDLVDCPPGVWKVDLQWVAGGLSYHRTARIVVEAGA